LEKQEAATKESNEKAEAAEVKKKADIAEKEATIKVRSRHIVHGKTRNDLLN